ncbi:hypothetical protein AOZ06_32415 [Kibdelosporangium phytohabitans]|uniref:Uncharacterized protein n=1 Tax=Kibdelosporangium phytohabitans TaxID=860235 RepID=A0A0N9I4H2_9PSEU|nr:hypothetical protein AOZ06_32415 [Kibdelosporangium phytohabitans]
MPFMNPPMPNRVHSLSWMNYPQACVPLGGGPSGVAAFPFVFDDLGLAHLRHGFPNAVIMDGNPFGIGAALDGANEYPDHVSDTTGLRLEITATRARPVLGMRTSWTSR